MSPISVRFSMFQLCLATLVAMLIGWTISSGPALAQKGSGLGKTEVMKILREQTLSDGQKKDFQNFFNTELFSQFVNGKTVSYDKYSKLRRDLKLYLTTGRTGQAHDELNRLALTAMKNIVGKKAVDDAAKINAIYVIGELNTVDAPGQAKPLPDSFVLLLAIVQSPNFKDALKDPALVGLERFAAADAIPATKKEAVTKVMLDLVNQKTPPANRAPEVHDWFRRAAAQVLAKMGSTGPDNSVVTAFSNIVGDDQARTSLRCEIAQLLGQLKFPPEAKLDFESLSKSLGYQTVEICNRELDRARVEKDTPRLRLIVYAAYSARDGLAGLQAAAGEGPQKETIDTLYEKVKKMHADLDDTAVVGDAIEPAVRTRVSDLQNFLGPKAQAPATKEKVAAAAPKEQPREPAKQ